MVDHAQNLTVSITTIPSQGRIENPRAWGAAEGALGKVHVNRAYTASILSRNLAVPNCHDSVKVGFFPLPSFSSSKGYLYAVLYCCAGTCTRTLVTGVSVLLC